MVGKGADSVLVDAIAVPAFLFHLSVQPLLEDCAIMGLQVAELDSMIAVII
jgi:hypothetical protein